MILVNHYAILPLIPKSIFVTQCRVEIMVFPFVLFRTDRFFNFYCLSSAILVCISAQTLPPATTCSYYSLAGATNLSLLDGVCAACMLAYRFLQMKWWAAVTTRIL